MMNVNADKKLLIEKVRAGNQLVWQDFIKENFVTVANFMARVVQEPNKAGLLTTSTFLTALTRIGGLAATPRSVQSWLLSQAKEVCFDSLTTEEYEKTVFKRGLELFSAPPHLKAIPDTIIDSDIPLSAEFVDTIYDGLQPECELLLELVFLEKIPLSEVAELLGISENLVNSFIFSILSALGNFADLPHKDDCRPDLFLCVETINALSDHELLKKKISNASRCESCTNVILRTVRLDQLFSLDRRPQVKPDEAVINELSLNRKTRPMERKVSTFVPIPVRMGPKKKISLARTVFPIVIIAIFVLAALEIFQENLITNLLPKAARSPFSKATGAIDVSKMKKLSRTIGHFYGATSSRTPLMPGQQLLSGMRSGLIAEYTSGPKVVIDAKTSVTTFRDRVNIMRGTSVIHVPKLQDTAFSAVTRDLIAELNDAKVSISTTPSRGTRLAVLKGQANVTLTDGTKLTVEQDQHILVGMKGKYEINDGVFDSSKTPSNLSSIPGSDEIIDRTLLKESTIEEIKKDRKTTKVMKSPEDGPPPAPFNGQNPYDVRSGYKNRF